MQEALAKSSDRPRIQTNLATMSYTVLGDSPTRTIFRCLCLTPPSSPLTGVGFLQLGGVTSIKGIYRSVRERTPTLEMNGNIVE